jgi:hypothetical protein
MTGAPEVVEHVFKMFAQAKRTSDRAQGGLGIGLALVKSLVELRHGTVMARRHGLGQGSSFSISLPRIEKLNLISAPAARSMQLSTGKRLRILIVDDNLDAALMLGMCFEASGHETIVEHHPKARWSAPTWACLTPACSILACQGWMETRWPNN